MFWFSLAISLCYLGAMMYGISAAVILLPLSGLFMSMMYPTLNSKGISCFPVDQHGSVAGVILFFTALSAALGPLLMGVVGDIFGHVKYGFYLATGFAFMLCLLATYNLLRDPSGHLLTADAK
jgi:fucose permease